MRLIATTVLFVGAVTLGACGGSSDTPDAEEGFDCTGDARAEVFTAQMKHVGDNGLIQFELVSSDPAPPQKGNNTWIVQLNSMSAGVVGAPLDGATISVRTFMPDHNHLGVTTNVTPMTDGKYTLHPVNTFMPGYWEITVTGTAAGGMTDKSTYKFCIPT